METITNLIKDTPIPKMVKVRQNFDKTCIPESDIPGIITRELRRRGGEAGKTTRRFLGSITHKGYIWRFDSVDALCPKVYELADS